jgi:hypothetical protein
MPRPLPTEAVFLNVPFDAAYRPLMEAIVFAVAFCNYQPRCALEATDAGQVRVQKIAEIIKQCAFGIHDISRADPDIKTGLPRFNMPFELGLYLGAKWFGDAGQRRKNTLVLDAERYRYQQFFSDIAGQDISAHQNKPDRVIAIIRNWLSDASPLHPMPSGSLVTRAYQQFCAGLPSLCLSLRLDPAELSFNDYVWVVNRWLAVSEPDLHA